MKGKNYDAPMGNSGKSGGTTDGYRGGSNAKMPNMSSGDRATPSPSPSMGSGGGITMSNEMRSDVTKSVSNHNPYPKGLA